MISLKTALSPDFLRRYRHIAFAAVYFIGWAAYAAGNFDYVFYSKNIGFSDTEIGVLFAAIGLIGLCLQPVAGFVCDRLKNTKAVLLALLSVGITASTLLPLMKGKIAVMAVVFTYTLFMSSFMPLMDNWVARECIGAENFHYGSIRLWGSLGFAIIIFIYGRLALTVNVSRLYFSRAALLLVTGLVITFFTAAGKAAQGPQQNSPGNPEAKPDIKGLLLKPEYLLLMVFAFIFCFPLNVTTSFLSKLLLSVGGSNATIGMFGGVIALVEIPFFLTSKRISAKVGYRGLMFMGCGFVTVRILCFSFLSSIPALLGVAVLVAPYTALFNPGLIYYIYSLSPKNTHAFAQTLAQAAAIGLSGMLGNVAGGYVIDHWGIRQMYFGSACINVIGIAFFAVVTLCFARRKKKSIAQGVA